VSLFAALLPTTLNEHDLLPEEANMFAGKSTGHGKLFVNRPGMGLIWLLAAVLLANCLAWAQAGKPVDIRLGDGFAAEETLWLMKAKPDLTPNQGKIYNLTLTPFRGNTDRFSAYQAGQLDGGTVAAFTALFAKAQNIPLKLVASIARESGKGERSTFLTLDGSGVNSVADLKGKTVGIVDYKSSTDLWARVAIKKAGLNPDRDVKIVVVPFPAQGESLRAKKIDAGIFPQPFLAIEESKGGTKKIFDSVSSVGFDQELMQIFFSPDFLQRHPEAVRAFLSDFVNTTKWYVANEKAARQALVDAKMVRVDPNVYINMKDYYRTPDGRPNLELMKKLGDMLVEFGWIEKSKRVNVNDLYDLSYLPKK
jgi:ABC-type nitrate/sulfonate/bicarbonate transport system substrate-binding protein